MPALITVILNSFEIGFCLLIECLCFPHHPATNSLHSCSDANSIPNSGGYFRFVTVLFVYF